MLPSETETYKRVAALPQPDKAKATSKIKYGLIVPPSVFVVPCGWEWAHRAPFEGPSIIASLVKGLGYEFKLFDQRAIKEPKDVLEKISGFDIVGIATYEDSFPYIKSVCEIIKKNNPKCVVMLGGPLVTSAPELIMKNTVADFAVIGEGELTLTELMDYIANNNYAKRIGDIDGLLWRNTSGKLIMNKKREQMDNLDAVPFQDLSVWEMYNGKDIPEVYLSYSRGCVCNCAFCYRPMPKLSHKSIDRVKSELAYLGKYNFKFAWWNDLTFVNNLDYVHKLLDEAFPAHPHRWCCFARAVGVDLPVLRHMKENGCDLILYGFESISQDILDCYRKGTNKHAIINTIQLTRESGIKCGGLLIVGAPNETMVEIDNLIEFCKEFKEVTRVKYLSILPGTALYRQALENGTITDELAHLYWLATEESVEEDIDRPGFIKMAKGLTRDQLKYAYHTVNTMIEQRPYNYEVEKNVFLKKPMAFKRGSDLEKARRIN